MMNVVILNGRIANDMELRKTSNDIAVLAFTVAVDRSYSKDKDNKVTDFINCVAWRKSAEFISKYFNKGDGILLEGELQSRKYTDNNGNNRTVNEVVVDKVNFAESKKVQKTEKNESENVQNYEFEEIGDEDLPF